MATIPYFLPLQQAVAANGAATLSYPVPANEKLRVKGIFVQSTGAFNITDMYDSRNIHIANSSSSKPIPNTMFQVAGSANLGIKEFPAVWNFEGNTQLNIDVVDTSAAPNTIRITLLCEKDVAGA